MHSSRQQNSFSRMRGRHSLNSVDLSPSGTGRPLVPRVSASGMSSLQHDSVNGPDNFIIGKQLTVMYFACKRETFHLRKNYKRFYRVLKSHLSCTVIQLDKDLGDGLLAFCNLVILAGLNDALNETELNLLLEYVQNGGSVLVLGESLASSQFYNAFTRHFGIVLFEDVVISVIRRKQYHPKECFVPNAVICPTLFKPNGGGGHRDDDDNVNIVYPHGCSLNIKNCLAAPIVSSGLSSFPCNRPLGAMYYNTESKGRVIVFGSGHAFTDEFIEMEDNRKLLAILLDILVTEDPLELIVRDSELMELEDFYCTGRKAGRFRGVMQDIDEYIFPGSINPMMSGSSKPLNLIPSNIGRLNYSLLNDVFNAYDQLQIPRVSLAQSVKPQIQSELFPPKLALFPPTFRSIAPPALELFDLDEDFSSIDTRLGRLVNKCTETDLEFFVESMGELLEVKVPESSENRAKSILHEMLSQLANFKNRTVNCAESDSDTTLSTASAISMIDDRYFHNDQNEGIRDEDFETGIQEIQGRHT